MTRDGDLLTLDFPSRPPAAIDFNRDEVAAALGAKPAAVLAARDLLAVFPSQAEVEALRPNFARVRALEAFAVIATAPGDRSDFVSRFFAPRAGIDEDPVTGSAHCTLVPYWSRRLGNERSSTRCRCRSRGGELFCEDRGERVAHRGSRSRIPSRGDHDMSPSQPQAQSPASARPSRVAKIALVSGGDHAGGDRHRHRSAR